jgi:AcrR family transcriptional regulator
MARPKKSENRDTRQAILDAALDLFAERGFFGTSMRQIAKEVGVRESALYHHFPSKDDIFKALITHLGPGRVSQVITVDIEAMAQALGVKELLSRLFNLIATTWAIPQEQKIFRIILQEGARLAAAKVVSPMNTMMQVRSQLVSMFEKLAARGLIRPIDPVATSLLFIGPMMFLRVLHTSSHPPDFAALEADSARLAAQLWQLLKPDPVTRPAKRTKRAS